MATLLPNGKQQFVDQNGNPLVGGKVYHYEPGTTTPKTTWLDSDQQSPNANPVILDGRGQASIYGSGAYRQVACDASNNLIWDQVVVDAFQYGSQLKSDLNNQSSATKGSALVGHRGRTVHAKLDEEISVDDIPGVSGNGAADDLASVNAAISTAPGREPVRLVRDYRVSARPTNPTGRDYAGKGKLLLDQDGYSYQINSYTHQIGLSWGREHLDKVWQRLEAGGQIRIQLYGDSTVAGGNGETSPFTTPELICAAFAQNGVPDVIVNNYGVGGTSWSDLNAIPNIDATAANSTDLLVIKYFINDFPKDPAAIFPIVDAKLADIRAATNGGVHKLSIIVMAASTTYDLPNGRDARWYEQLRAGIVQLCGKHKCAFFDTYALMQDSTVAAGYWMDQPWAGKPWAVHMLNRGQNIVWNALVREFFPAEFLRQFGTNFFANYGASSGMPEASVSADNYAKGLTSYRATWAERNGAVWTRRNKDGITDQEVIPFAGANPIPARRTWIIGTGWSAWSGVTYALASYLATNVAAYGGSRRAPGYHRDTDGRLWLEGSITVSANKAVGDQLCGALPVGFRVIGGDQVGFASGSGGGVRLLFLATGEILFQSAVTAGTEISLDMVSAFLG